MKYFLGIIAMILVVSMGWFALTQNAQDTSVATQEEGEEKQEYDVLQNQEQFSDTYVVDDADYVDATMLIEDLDVSTLSKEEAEGILFMREEEKLARDVYQALYEKWGVKIFSNIAASEQTHMDAVLTLIERYNLTDPASSEFGVFENEILQTLYTELVSNGSESLSDAYRVGALIEDLDIYDLGRYIASVDQSDITLVYENLQRGSRNHLRAFNRQLVGSTGENYTPEYISEAEFLTIIGSDSETGARGERRN